MSRIAGEVVRRLKHADVDAEFGKPAAQKINPTLLVDSRPLWCADDIQRLAHDQAELHIAKAAVMTPSAIDIARERGIRIIRDQTERSRFGNPQTAPTTNVQLCDWENRGTLQDALAGQLNRQGWTVDKISISSLSSASGPSDNTLLLCTSSTAALTVARLCQRGWDAAQVERTSDIDQILPAWQPNIWVASDSLLPLPLIVSVFARIIRCCAGAGGPH
ncbi:MAG: hypothetical protein AAFP90_17265 [Planctomycetota bacterium]